MHSAHHTPTQHPAPACCREMTRILKYAPVKPGRTMMTSSLSSGKKIIQLTPRPVAARPSARPSVRPPATDVFIGANHLSKYITEAARWHRQRTSIASRYRLQITFRHHYRPIPIPLHTVATAAAAAAAEQPWF